MHSVFHCNETLHNIQIRLSTRRCLLCYRCQKWLLIMLVGQIPNPFLHTPWAYVHMNCITGEVMKGFLSFGTGHSSCHFHIMYEYSWSLSFFCMSTTSSILTLASLSRVPVSTSTTGTVKCCYFLGVTHPLQGRSGGGFPKTDFKKGTSVFCLQALGWNFVLFYLGSRDSQILFPWDNEILDSWEMSIVKFFDPETPGSWDLMNAKFEYREICWLLDSSIVRFNDHEIWQLQKIKFCRFFYFCYVHHL